MSDRAHAIALALIRSGVHLGADVGQPSSLLDWISELAEHSSRYKAAQLTFDGLSESESSVNTAGHDMAYELGRSGYELGLYVGLRLRNLEDSSIHGSQELADSQRQPSAASGEGEGLASVAKDTSS